MAKPYDFDRFGLGRAGEYFANFSTSKENVWRKGGQSKNALGFFISNQTHDSGSQGQGAKVRGFYSKPGHF